MTFEQLIRQDLMDAVKASLPAIALDDSGEPETARVLVTERDFADDEPRSYRLGVAGNPPQMTVAKATADVTVTAQLELHGKQRTDLEGLFAALLAADSVVWNWRGYPVRVDRRLLATRLAKVDTGVLREVVQVVYTAPYLETKQLPVIGDESWFDGWDYQVEPLS
jgi:hypothetical protein